MNKTITLKRKWLKTLGIVFIVLVAIGGIAYAINDQISNNRNVAYIKGIRDGQILYQNAIISQLITTGQVVLTIRNKNQSKTILLRPIQNLRK